jgi:hypothetical protein
MINGLCRLSDHDRASIGKYLLFRMDGGSCFFEAYYDTKAKKLIMFNLHGLA